MDLVHRFTSLTSRSTFLPRKLLFLLFLALNGIIILLSLSSYEPTRKWAISGAEYIKDQGTLLSGQWLANSSLPMIRRDCRVCGVAPSLCEEYGASNVARAMSFMGSGERMRRFLVKAREGKGFDVGVIGGSVSHGYGIKSNDGRNSPSNVHRMVFDHLNSLYPSPEGTSFEYGKGKADGKNGFVNGAKGATGSKYFSLCYALHIPESVDLVLLELGINDLTLDDVGPYEVMVRSLLDLPGQPAIINLQVLALIFAKMSMGTENHLGMVQYYDLPNISIKNLILPSILEDDKLLRKWFHTDWVTKPGVKDKQAHSDLRHMSNAAHKLLGQLTIAYIDTQVCELEEYELIHGTVTLDSLTPQPLPRLRLGDRYERGSKNTPKLQPQCFAAKNDIHPLIPSENKGWREWSWRWKHYLIADEPGSKVKFKISTSLGSISVSFLRSKDFGFGSAKCWVDDDQDKAKRMDGYWNQPQNIAQSHTIADKLSPGEHELTCELLSETNDPSGKTEFRLISIMSI